MKEVVAKKEMDDPQRKILDFMKNEDYVPMKAKEIAMLMRVPKNEYNNFLEIIGKLELELKIQKNRKNRYRISEKTYYEGYYRKNQKGFGFVKIEEQEDSFKIEVNVHSKALEYYIARDTRKYISGDRYNRVERMNKLIYTKLKNSQDMGVARKCPSCGANIDVNKNGQCEYCGAIFNLQNYDWVITYMDV